MTKINHVIYFSQWQLLPAKTNEDRTTSRKALLHKVTWKAWRNDQNQTYERWLCGESITKGNTFLIHFAMKSMAKLDQKQAYMQNEMESKYIQDDIVVNKKMKLKANWHDQNQEYSKMTWKPWWHDKNKYYFRWRNNQIYQDEITKK